MLENSVGNWVGTGTFKMLSKVLPVLETLAVFKTDIEGVYSYIRKSNIGVGEDTETHDEAGYIGVVYSQVALSRGTIVRLEKVLNTPNSISYEAKLMSDDVVSMNREVSILDSGNKMQWDNVMRVTGDGALSAEHEIKTTFIRVGKV